MESCALWERWRLFTNTKRMFIYVDEQLMHDWTVHTNLSSQSLRFVDVTCFKSIAGSLSLFLGWRSKIYRRFGHSLSTRLAATDIYMHCVNIVKLFTYNFKPRNTINNLAYFLQSSFSNKPLQIFKNRSAVKPNSSCSSSPNPATNIDINFPEENVKFSRK